VTGFAGKHPLIAGMVLMLGHGVVLAAAAIAAIASQSFVVGQYVTNALWITTGLLSVGIGCWLTMLRRRSCQPVWPVCWLALLAPPKRISRLLLSAWRLTRTCWGRARFLRQPPTLAGMPCMSTSPAT
jgi:hypothetical protein